MSFGRAARALLLLPALVAAIAVGAAAQTLGEGGPSAGRVIWLRPDKLVTRGVSDLVGFWGDSSGHGNHVYALNAEAKPQWLEAGLNGRNALQFDGNDYLAGGGMPTRSYTKAAVVVLDDLSYVNNVVSSASHHALYFGGSPYARLFHSGDFVTSSVAVTAGVPFVVIGTYDSVTNVGVLYVDGQEVGRATASSDNWDSSLQIGAFAYWYFMKGTVGEVIVWNRVLTPSDLTWVNGYLRGRYFPGNVAAVDWSALPRPGQLFQRDASDTASLDVNGTVTSPGFTDVEVEVTRDGAPWFSQKSPLVYSGSTASFAFSTSLFAGTFDYELSAWAWAGAERQLVARVPNLAVGDVWIINGQSNAQASDYWGEGLANASQSHWIRSFGTASIWGTTEFDLHWDHADGQNWLGHASVGQWGLRLAEILLKREQVPIAILNGAVGGTSITLHQRNDGNPVDLSTIYGRLLRRAIEAGVTDRVKAILWYQGESDSGNAAVWYADWLALRTDWLVDYPAVQKLYVVQIRSDCGYGGQDVQEIQRQLPALFSDTCLMSATALVAHDGCHFLYAGYRQLGDQLARLIRRDFHGSTDTYEIDPPNLASAQWVAGSSQKKVRLTMVDPNDRLVVDAGAEANFVLSDGTAVTGATTSGNTVTLTLAASSSAATISYRGHPFDGPWFRNVRGVGALCFEEVAIQ